MWKLKALLRSLTKKILPLFAFRGRKRISAMMRVRNEEQFIEAAILSIIDHVDEVVIIDNMSDDQTPKIISRLADKYPGKIRALVYPHKVARYGEENRKLASTSKGRRSPALLSNFYNWCVAQCQYPFILKWDGDTVATNEFGVEMEKFRTARAQSLWHTGVNLHENRTCLISGRPFEDMEPRLFPRTLSKYDNGLGYCEELKSPFIHGEDNIYVDRCETPLYVHMKFCKVDKFSNMSEDIQERERQNNQVGQVADQNIIETVAKWNL